MSTPYTRAAERLSLICSDGIRTHVRQDESDTRKENFGSKAGKAGGAKTAKNYSAFSLKRVNGRSKSWKNGTYSK